MADKKELIEFCDTAAGLADKINKELVETDTAIEYEKWGELAEKAKASLSELIDLIEDEIEKLE